MSFVDRRYIKTRGRCVLLKIFSFETRGFCETPFRSRISLLFHNRGFPARISSFDNPPLFFSDPIAPFSRGRIEQKETTLTRIRDEAE